MFARRFVTRGISPNACRLSSKQEARLIQRNNSNARDEAVCGAGRLPPDLECNQSNQHDNNPGRLNRRDDVTEDNSAEHSRAQWLKMLMIAVRNAPIRTVERNINKIAAVVAKPRG